MKIKEKRGYLLVALALAVFNVIAFFAPFVKNGVFAAAYLFGCVAIVSQIYFFKVSFADGKEVKSKFYGFPIVRIGLIYLVVQLVVSLLEMCMAVILPLWVPVLLNVVITAAAFAGAIAADIVRDEIERQEVYLKKNVSMMRKLQSKAADLMEMGKGMKAEAIIANLAEELRYSDPVSGEQTEELEAGLDGLLKELQEAVERKDEEITERLAKKCLLNLKERNRVCRLGK